MKTRDQKEAVEAIDYKLADAAKKRKVYFFLAWPMMVLGIIMLFSNSTKQFGFALILAGVVFRILYYRARHAHLSLSRYKREITGKLSLFAFFIVAACVAFPLHAQLNIGDQAPSPSGLVPVANSTPLNPGKQKKSIMVIEFWATWDKTSKLNFNLLSEIQNSLPVENVVFVQISKESAKTVKDFIDKLPVKPECAVYVDPNGAFIEKYLGKGAGIPQVFIIDSNSKILWKGELVNLKYVLGKVISGEFNLETQNAVIPLRENLRRSMQLRRYADAKRFVSEILKIDPADELAARVKMFFFERDKRMDEAVPFIDSLLKRSPNTPFLHLLKLDALNLTNASPEQLREAATQAFKAFGENHTALNRLADLLINRLRFGTAPMDVALKASVKAVDLFFSRNLTDPARLGRYLETRAKTFYLIGKIDDAIESQSKAVKLMKDERSEKRANIILNYYKSIKAVRRKTN